MCSCLVFLACLIPCLLISTDYYVTNFTPFSGTYPIFATEPNFDIDQLDSHFVEGRTFLVTGGNTGLGFESTKMLAEKGGRVVITCRNEKKCKDAIARLPAGLQGNVVFLKELELSSLQSVKEFAQAYKESGMALDVLMLNAGMMMHPYALSQDGIEMQLAVNHFSHAALTFELIDLLLQSKYNPRIVILSSSAHRRTHEQGVYTDMNKVNDESLYSPGVMYSQSKLANILFGVELQKRLDTYTDKKVFVNIVHPGVVATDLANHLVPGWLNENRDTVEKIVYTLGIVWEPKSGSLTQVAAAVDPRIEKQNIKARYFVPIFKDFPSGLSEISKDEALRLRFWDFTVKVLKDNGFSSVLF